MTIQIPSIIVIQIHAYTHYLFPHAIWPIPHPLTSLPLHSPLSLPILRQIQRLNIPNTLRILINTPITREEAHARHTRNTLRQPLILIPIRRIHQLLRLDVAAEVIRHEVVVAVLLDRRDQVAERPRVPERVRLDAVEDRAEVRVQRVRGVRVRVPQVLDLLGEVAEEEDVVLADLARDFDLEALAARSWACAEGRGTYIGTVAGSDDQTAVQHELHVARARCLGSGGGDVLADVAGWDDDLGLADVVVLDEDDFQEISNILVIVDNSTNAVDQVDDSLSHPVTRSSLATEDRDSRDLLLALLWRHGLDRQVSVDDSEDVHLLTLVLVYAFDLDVEECRRINRNASSLLDMPSKSDLIGVFNLLPFLLERLIISIWLEFVQQSEILQEFEATRLRSDEFREARVGLVQPSPWSDTIRNIREAVETKNLDKVLENGSLDQV